MQETSASKTTREELLKWAQEFLQSRGPAGFSFQDLADRLKIKKASIHYYFKTKNELFRVLIENYRASFQEWTASVAAHSAPEKWRGFVELYRGFILDQRRLCPSGAMSLELAELPEPLRRQLCDFQIEQRQWIEEMVLQGQQENFFMSEIHPRAAAILIGSALQGSLQIAKLHDSPVVFEKVMGELEHLLKGARK